MPAQLEALCAAANKRIADYIASARRVGTVWAGLGGRAQA